MTTYHCNDCGHDFESDYDVCPLCDSDYVSPSFDDDNEDDNEDEDLNEDYDYEESDPYQGGAALF